MKKQLFIGALALASLLGVAQNKISKKIKNTPTSERSVLTAPSNYYAFSTFTASYQAITGTSVTSAGTKWDEPTDTIHIGFNFKLYNAQNDSVQLQGGSYFSFDDLVNGNTLTTGSPMFEDLCDRAYNPNSDNEGDPGGISPITYTTTGTAGSRICKIQVSNAGFYPENNANSTSTSFVNFQVWLYETTNNIEFRYGSVSIQTPSLNLQNSTGFICGLMDSLDYNTSAAASANMLNGPYASPAMVGPNPNFTDVISGNITSGTVYKFTRNTLVTSISKVSVFGNISLFPNPAKDKLFISNISSELSNANIEFYDVAGKLIHTEKIASEINLSGFNKGIYFLKIKTATNQSAFINKIVITD